MLKQEGVKHVGIKEGLGVLTNFHYLFFVIAM